MIWNLESSIVCYLNPGNSEQMMVQFKALGKDTQCVRFHDYLMT